MNPYCHGSFGFVFFVLCWVCSVLFLCFGLSTPLKKLKIPKSSFFFDFSDDLSSCDGDGRLDFVLFEDDDDDFFLLDLRGGGGPKRASTKSQRRRSSFGFGFGCSRLAAFGCDRGGGGGFLLWVLI